MNGDYLEVKRLLDEGRDPNKINSQKMTPLMMASEFEEEKIIRLLVSYGADVNLQGHEGVSPLHLAVDVSIDGTIQSGGDNGDEPTNIMN